MVVEKKHPVDRGWAWVVAFAGMAIYFILIGLSKVRGVILIEVEVLLNLSSYEIALIVGLKAISSSISSLFTMGFISDLVHMRILIIIGGIIVALSFSICIWADSVYYMYAYSIISGIGFSAVWGACIIVVGQYFNKHHAKAQAIVTSGTSLGAVIFPFILKFLLDTYSFRGAMLIIGAFCLNITVGGWLMRPPEFYSRFSLDKNTEHVEMHESEKYTDNIVDATTDSELNNYHDERLVPKQIYTSLADNGDNQSETEKGNRLALNADDTFNHETSLRLLHVDTPEVTRSCPNITSKKETQDIKCRNRFLDIDLHSTKSSMLSVYTNDAMQLPLNTASQIESHRTREKSSNKYSFFFKTRESEKKIKIFDIELLKNYVFASLVIGSSLIFAATSITLAYLAPFAMETGVSLQDITIMISVYGAFELVGRLLYGFLGDSVWINRTHLVVVSGVLYGILMNCIRFFRGFWPLLVFHVLMAVVHSAYFVLTPVITADLFGEGVQARVWGITLLLRGILIVALTQAVGYIRSKTGSYGSSFNLIGATIIAGCAIWFFITFPLAKKQRDKNNETDIIVED